MDTIPFHLILLAIDLLVLGGLFLWIRFRQNSSQSKTAAYEYEKSLYVPTVKVKKPSLLWDWAGCILFGCVGLFFFALFSRLIWTDLFQKHIYHFNVGQCIIEGLFYHLPVSLLVAAGLLYWNKRIVSAIAVGFVGLCFAALGYDLIWYEPYALVVECYTIKTSKLTKPLRIVFVADIQTDRIGEYEERTLKTVQKQHGDIIILGGDYLQAYAGTPHADQLPQLWKELFQKAKLEAPLGVYAIEGNIGPTSEEMFEDTGVDVIKSSTILENLGADKDIGPIDVVLLGLGDSVGSVNERGLTDTGNFIVMAGHFPNYAIDGYQGKTRKRTGYRQLERAPDLMLAGHTHGGQFCLPGIGSYRVLIDRYKFLTDRIPFIGKAMHDFGDNYVQQIPPEMMSGFFAYANGSHALISRGSGMECGWAPRARFCCPSEISVIDLIPEQKNETPKTNEK
ncbi:hypothetical protein FACS189443_3260 [Planctomycetales bacterium]|nr:hypothetical protein FACS189443_3260 [Planctomycetales bacterium]